MHPTPVGVSRQKICCNAPNLGGGIRAKENGVMHPTPVGYQKEKTVVMHPTLVGVSEQKLIGMHLTSVGNIGQKKSIGGFSKGRKMSECTIPWWGI